MNKFSMKKKGKEVPTEAVIAYSKANMFEKIGKKDQAIQSYIIAGNQNHVKAQYSNYIQFCPPCKDKCT